MICVSIAQSSRTLAKVDILNAASQCDMIEIQLDAFEEAPKIKELIEVSSKPLIFSCRREKDGGKWRDEDEANRLILLRQAVLDKATYVEIEVDAAKQIPRYGATKRIVSYTNLIEVPDDLEDIYDDCKSKDPDIIKITVPARTPEETWPIIKMIARGGVPTVAVGIGRNAVLLSLLGRRYKSPWLYAALEKGMEAYPGIATVRELKESFNVYELTPKTPMLGVSGSRVDQRRMSHVLNRAFGAVDSKIRALPLEVNDMEMFVKIAKATKLEGLIVDPSHQVEAVEVCSTLHQNAKEAGAVDLIADQDGNWLGFNVMARAVVNGIGDRLKELYPTEDAFEKRMILVVGAGGLGRSIAAGLKRKGSSVSLADKDNKRAQALCEQIGVRYLPAGQVYSSLPDVMVVTAADVEPEKGKAAIDIPKSCARQGMVVADMSNFPDSTPLIVETKLLNGKVVAPLDVLLLTLGSIVKAYTKNDLSIDQLRAFADDLEWDE
jgi:3-dehydroquinate dehydratase/shikimate dehydrogenase